MSINEIEQLMKKLVEDNSLSDKEKKSLSSKIKRSYNIKKQELKAKGNNFSFESLNKLLSILISNYDKLKNNEIINEIMQEIAEDYSQLSPNKKNTPDVIDRKVLLIYTHILGNPGTHTNGMTSDFISNIIRLKQTENETLNSEDILNILAMQSKNMYLDIAEYQKLINRTVIAYLNYNINGHSFTNPKILKIFENLAASYKISEEFDKVKEIYEQALSMNLLKNTPEYKELEKHYHEFLEFMISRANAGEGKYNSVEEFTNSLKTTVSEQGLFVKGTRNPSNTPSQRTNTSYIMPVEDRIRAIEILLYKLKEKNPKCDTIEKVVFPDDESTYSNYIQIKIKGTNISILENFVEDNPRIFVLKDESIDQIRPLSRWDALKVEGVEGLNHIENFENYCYNLYRAVMKLIRETTPIRNQEDPDIRFGEDDSIFTPSVPIDTDELEKSPDETIERENSEEIVDKDENQVDGEGKDKIEVKAESEPEPEPKPKDIVEAERQKAHKNRKYLRQLEAEIEKIQMEAEEKIAKIRQQMANLENGDDNK